MIVGVEIRASKLVTGSILCVDIMDSRMALPVAYFVGNGV
jgi:hypothetical protein